MTNQKLKIVLFRGLPASGKSTFGKELLKKEPNKWKRVNRDLIREMFDGGKWSSRNEKFVVKMEELLIRQALENEYSVLIDDCNLNPKNEIRYKELCNEYNNVDFEIKDFIEVSLEECLRRDRGRGDKSVGDKVIIGMWSQFLKPKPVEYNENLPDAILIDIDGTTCLFGNKNPFERDFENDELNVPVFHIVDAMRKKGYKIIFASGRKDIYRDVTEKWLRKWIGEYDHLYMRKIAPEGQNEPSDIVVKTDIYNTYIKGKYNIFFCIDDRPRIIRLYRSLGLTVFDVGDGVDF